MKKYILTITAAILFAWQTLSFATSSVDVLIQKLQDKGILTYGEASQIKGEIASEEKNSQQASFKSLAPDWLSGLKISGDFRLRDQLERKKGSALSAPSEKTQTYNRGRIRARLNFEDQINDKLKLVVGIATSGEKNGYGTGNPRSSNITFGGNNAGEGSFSKAPVVLSKAYVVYTPKDWLTLEGGQIDNPLWAPGNSALLWDPNVTPQGGAILLQKKLNDYITPFSTSSFFVLKNWKDETLTQYTTGGTPALTGYTIPHTDPYLFVTQDGIKGNLTDKFYYKGAFSWYNVNNPSHVWLDGQISTAATSAPTPLALSASGNSVGAQLWQDRYGYNLFGGAVDFGINNPFGELLPSRISIPQIGLFGEFYTNVIPSHQNNAWTMGAYLGNSAVNGWGTWKFTSSYQVLESDAWLDCFPNNDLYSGNANVAGWRQQLDIGLAKNVYFTLSYYNTNWYKYSATAVQGTSTSTAANPYGIGSAPNNTYQFDLNLKF